MESRILRMVRLVLASVVKDTTTQPGLKHPLSDQTIEQIRDCLQLISAREQELSGDKPQARPRFVDEPRDSVVVTLKPKTKAKDKDDDA